MEVPWRMEPLRWWARQRWLPLSLRDRVLRRFAACDALPSTRFTTDFFGMRYDGDLASFIDWSVFFYGAYEPALLAFLADAAAALGGREAVVLDVGANVGQHSLFLAPRVARVHAFEPWEPARRSLEEKLALNGLGNVVVHPDALSDCSDVLPFYAPTTANRGTGSFLPEHNFSNRATGSLALVRGDDVLAAEGEQRIDLIKIDTEGFEDRVLAGLAGTLARHRPVVVFELSPATASQLSASGDVLAGLEPLFGSDWRLYRLDGHERYVLAPFTGNDDTATLVAVPREKDGALPRRGP